MKNRKKKVVMRMKERRYYASFLIVFLLLAVSMFALDCFAVSSKITRHDTGAELLKGEVNDVVVSSRGTIQLGRSSEVLVNDFDDINEPWSINCIVVSGPTIYFGTSPNGGIYSYTFGKLEKIYPAGGGDKEKVQPKQPKTKKSFLGERQSAQKSGDPNSDIEKGQTVKAKEHLTNEHIFAMTTDVSGRLLAGISGKTCKLIRFKSGGVETIFEPDDTKYIFAMITDAKGNIYLGTGPKGKVFMLDSFGRDPKLIYESRDKNILSLTVGDDGFIYAGSDERGLVYKINPRTKTAAVLYDSDQPEITSLLLTEEDSLYAAATSAEIVQTQVKFASQLSLAGRPESKSDKSTNDKPGTSGRKLEIANTKKSSDEKKAARPSIIPKGTKPGSVSFIYKITGAGYVKEEFKEAVVLFCLAEQQSSLLVGSGNNGQLFSIEPVAEQQSIIYEDRQASQITAVSVSGDEVYVGTANPAKLLKLNTTFASEGTYDSDLIDADQPARWGKLQIDADIPYGCKVMACSRSGNVKDVNDPSFSDWSVPVEVTEPIQLDCPIGRFCQYKLVLKSSDGRQSPLIREIAVASTVPNLAPKVESVGASRLEASGKEGVFKIEYKAKDDNADKLTYKIDFRKIPRSKWIELKDETEAASFEWDSKTVEDGKYEIRVTASDEKSNTNITKLTGSRVSDPVVVDNTAPVVAKSEIKVIGKKVTLNFTVKDEFTVIGKVYYTVDSNKDWIGAMPDDLVYDTTKEDFNIVIENLKPGEHIISLKVSDDVGNTAYKTFEINVAGN